jgi:hypothetical protein
LQAHASKFHLKYANLMPLPAGLAQLSSKKYLSATMRLPVARQREESQTKGAKLILGGALRKFPEEPEVLNAEFQFFFMSNI